MRTFLLYFIPVALCFLVGWAGSYVQGPALVEWYPYIAKSPLTPPAIVFPIAWSVLYLLMGVSLGVMLHRGDLSMLRLWIAQLIVNFLWSVTFFGLRSPLLGLITILILDVLVFAYILLTINRRPLAAWLFVPYMLWLCFATYLNGYIYIHNNIYIKENTMTTVATKFVLPSLPYATSALAPAMSAETIDYHFGKHFATYLNNTNRLVEGTHFEGMTLENIVREADGALLNNAAQSLNHHLFFEALTPTPKPIPERLQRRIVRDFGSVEEFNKRFEDLAVGLFGSGWVWLAEDKQGYLHLMPGKDADNPIRHNLEPLMCIDVWEHAYYIDYRNRRADFVRAYMNLIDWDKVQARSAF